MPEDTTTRDVTTQELYHTLSQQLFSIHLMAETIARLLPDQPTQLTTLVDDLNQTTHGAQAALQALIKTLRPTPTTSVDIVTRLQLLTFQFEQEYAGVIYLRHKGRAGTVKTIENALYRIAQLALRFAFRERQARCAYVTLECSPKCVTLTLKDNGLCDDVTSIPDFILMRDHATAIGATLQTRVSSEAERIIKVTWRPVA